MLPKANNRSAIIATIFLLCLIMLPGTRTISAAQADATDNVVKAWGANNSGQLGTGSIVYSNTPLTTPRVSDVVSIAAGFNHSLALTRDGRVWAWGANDQGQLGTMAGRCKEWNGFYPCSLTPLLVPHLTGVIAIAAGGNNSLALTRDGSVWEWGSNGNQQLGFPTSETNDATLAPQLTPARLPLMSQVVAIATSPDGLTNLALRQDGTVWQWGFPEIVVGAGLSDSESINRVPLLAHVTAIAASYSSRFAVKNDGTLWAWGWSTAGDLGIEKASAPYYKRPQQVPNLTQVIAVAAGAYHTLALKKDGTVWGWGENTFCLLSAGGCNDYTLKILPVQVSHLTNVAAIAAGDNHDAALTHSGQVWVWGDNSEGQLGFGTSGGYAAAPIFAHIQHAVAIAVGANHTLAISALSSPHIW